MGHPDNDQSSKHIVKQRFNFLVIHDFTLYRLIKANQIKSLKEQYLVLLHHCITSDDIFTKISKSIE